MSFRYASGIVKPGFNPLAAQTSTIQATLFTWGLNNEGQLGHGNTTYYSSPKQVGSLNNWSKFAAGGASVLSVKNDGTLWSWGINNGGVLGLGNTTSYSSPKQVGSLSAWLNVASGRYHSISIKTDGTLWTWGRNDNGQLGDGTSINKSSPVQIGALTTWYKIAGGTFSAATYAIKTDGTLWAWGLNNLGQLGLGNRTYYSSPKQIGALTTWFNISGGEYYAVATKTDGTLWVWGRNNQSQLGLGSASGNYSSPKQVGSLTTWYTVSCGKEFSFAIKTDGTMWSWGDNGHGQLGIGTNTTDYSSPRQIGALTTWLNVSCGVYHAIAVKTNGTVWSWGANYHGMLGLGSRTAYSSPRQIGTLATWGSIASGSYFTVAG